MIISLAALGVGVLLLMKNSKPKVNPNNIVEALSQLPQGEAPKQSDFDVFGLSSIQYVR